MFRNYLVGKGLGQRPIWALEEGFGEPDRRDNPYLSTSHKQQAEEVIKRFVILMDRDIEHINYFNLYHHSPGDLFENRNMILEEYEGQPETDWIKRPAFSYGLMTEKLGGYVSVDMLSEDPSTFYGYEFTIDGEKIGVF